MQLEQAHAQACQQVHAVQEKLARAEEYKAMSRQQHTIIRALERAIVSSDPKALNSETLLDSTSYKRLLASHLLLRQQRSSLTRSTASTAQKGNQALSASAEVKQLSLSQALALSPQLAAAVSRLQGARQQRSELERKLDQRSPSQKDGLLPQSAKEADHASTQVQRDLQRQIAALEQRKSSLEQEIRRIAQVGSRRRERNAVKL